MSIPKIYKLNRGYATKYYWFNLVEHVYEGMDSDTKIKTQRISFSKYSGSTEADCHGCTLGYTFYSEKLLAIAERCNVKSFTKYEVKFHPKLAIQSKYYYVEIDSTLPRITGADQFSEPDLEKYCREHDTKPSLILNLSSSINPLYADFSKWDGSAIFQLENSWLFMLTDELRIEMEKGKLKNVKFEECRFCE